jgi:hypothetical protein
MFGYIHVKLPKKLPPEVWQIPLKTPCINKKNNILKTQTFGTEMYVKCLYIKARYLLGKSLISTNNKVTHVVNKVLS